MQAKKICNKILRAEEQNIIIITVHNKYTIGHWVKCICIRTLIMKFNLQPYVAFCFYPIHFRFEKFPFRTMLKRFFFFIFKSEKKRLVTFQIDKEMYITKKKNRVQSMLHWMMIFERKKKTQEKNCDIVTQWLCDSVVMFL